MSYHHIQRCTPMKAAQRYIKALRRHDLMGADHMARYLRNAVTMFPELLAPGYTIEDLFQKLHRFHRVITRRKHPLFRYRMQQRIDQYLEAVFQQNVVHEASVIFFVMHDITKTLANDPSPRKQEHVAATITALQDVMDTHNPVFEEWQQSCKQNLSTL